MTHGNMTQGNMTHANTTHGNMTSGATNSGATTSGATTSGATTSGATTNGSTAHTDPSVAAILTRVFDRKERWEIRDRAFHDLEPEDWREVALQILTSLEELFEAVRLTTEDSWLDGLRGRTLIHLSHGKDLPLGTLAARTHVGEPAMCKAVTALQRRGFVTRVRHEADARMIRVRATPEGLAAAAAWQRERCSVLSRWLKWLAPRELDLLVDVTRVADWLSTRMVDIPLRPLE
jgi:DNA-binding MarR family transcriptional regulator